LAAFTSPILKDPDAPVPFDCFKLLFFTPALSSSRSAFAMHKQKSRSSWDYFQIVIRSVYIILWKDY
jgi:hypothetical protein